MRWRNFLRICSDHIYKEGVDEPFFWSWCSWTTYSRLKRDSGYWTAPLPLAEELLENSILDGGMWAQPFFYDELAHVIIPKIYTFSKLIDGLPCLMEKNQDIAGISEILKTENIPHNISEYALDMKLY